MPQSLAAIYVHLVFSTKHRSPILHESIRSDLSAYIGGILRERGCRSLCVGAAVDHVHVLLRLSRTSALADVVQHVKTGSSKWIKTRGEAFAGLSWQNGYAAFSVSASRLDAVRRYVRTQGEHHRGMSYQDELREFLRAHGVTYDERYLWD